MAILNGLHAGTGSNLQLDAGILCMNVTESQIETLPDWGSIVKQGILGATKGGASFTATPEFRSLLDGVNGSRGNYKNGQVIDSWDISLKTTISEMTAANIKLAMATGAGSDSTHGNLIKNKASVGLVKDAHYSKSLVWIGSMAGAEKDPMVIFMKDVLNVNGINFTAEDKNTGSIELEIKAHFDLSKPEDVPFFIYTAKERGDS